MSRGFEDDILRPAVIAALSQIPYWTGHVAPVEVLHQSGGKLRGAVLAAGIGPGPGRTRALAEINYDTNCTGCSDRTVDDIEEVTTAPPFAEVQEIDWSIYRN